MVMEFVEGQTLRELMAIRKSIEPTTALRLMVDVAAKKAEIWQRAKMTEMNAVCLERLKKAGMQINEIPESELDRFRKVTYEMVFPTVIKNKDLGPNTKELIDMVIWAQQ